MNPKTKHIIVIFICSTIILSLVVGSLIFNVVFNGEIPQTRVLNDDSGNLIAIAPFPPSFQFPMGTDRDGNDMFYVILKGAMYTIGVSLIISCLSFALAFVFGIIGAFTKSKSKYITQTLFTSFYFIPQSIIAYNLLFPFLWEPPGGYTTTLTERIVLQIVVLSILTLPTTAILISNEAVQLLQKEYITSAKVLGASRFFILRKHLLPHLKLRLFIIYPKIIIQVLLILAHLGFFNLFLGGTAVDHEYGGSPAPYVNEWAGFMGTNYLELYNKAWIFLGPMFFFALTILLLNGLSKGIENLLETQLDPQIIHKKQNIKSKTIIGVSNIKKDDFSLVKSS
ncbi:ABC transporter permease [Chengkuizengella axinellae]|uniref:ABC transporter permease subunit n=1 Tax=Chengkuizengella axinellae TaxID=3064388 RepID=A0ABT9J3X3_9BACL|nr:ABC transporter permease subunit [Chengkuizengella sp. 2205SS18-9]MDP5276306.1 ABC transporter permease subunit [Chengkuizengella sp. 2205SS18-9]